MVLKRGTTVRCIKSCEPYLTAGKSYVLTKPTNDIDTDWPTSEVWMVCDDGRDRYIVSTGSNFRAFFVLGEKKLRRTMPDWF
jgi:hypothetical protein